MKFFFKLKSSKSNAHQLLQTAIKSWLNLSQSNHHSSACNRTNSQQRLVNHAQASGRYEILCANFHLFLQIVIRAHQSSAKLVDRNRILGSPPFFVNRFDDFFNPLISFLFVTWGENAWIFRSIFPAGDQLSRPPSMATRLAQHIGWHPTVCDLDNRGNKTRNGSDWSRQEKKEHTVGWEVDKLWKECEEMKY